MFFVALSFKKKNFVRNIYLYFLRKTQVICVWGRRTSEVSWRLIELINRHPQMWLHRRLSCQHCNTVNGNSNKDYQERAGAGHVIILPPDTKILWVWQRNCSGLKTLAQIKRVYVHKWCLTLFINELFRHSWHAESHQIVLSLRSPAKTTARHPALSTPLPD